MAKKKKNKFPQDLPGIQALGQDMANGFANNTDVYPEPPVKPEALKARLASVQNRINAITAAEAAVKAAIDAKDEEVAELVEEMKEDIDYAEYITKGDDAKLKLINWSGRAAPKPLEPPGLARSFELIGQGAGWVRFDWKEPKDGGNVQYYKLMRRELKSGGDMKEAGSSVPSEIIVVDQPRGVELEYAVVSVNRAGESQPSNSITIVL